MLHKISFCFDWIKLLDEVWPRRIALWIVVCVLNYKKYIKHALIYRVRKCDLCTWVRFKTFIIYIICTLNEGHKGIIDFIIFFFCHCHTKFFVFFFSSCGQLNWILYGRNAMGFKLVYPARMTKSASCAGRHEREHFFCIRIKQKQRWQRIVWCVEQELFFFYIIVIQKWIEDTLQNSWFFFTWNVGPVTILYTIYIILIFSLTSRDVWLKKKNSIRELFFFFPVPRPDLALLLLFSSLCYFKPNKKWKYFFNSSSYMYH